MTNIQIFTRNWPNKLLVQQGRHHLSSLNNRHENWRRGWDPWRRHARIGTGSPLQTFDSVDLYPTIADKLTRLSFGLVMNHPFLDGNKRIGAYVLTVGLKLNGIPFSSCSFTAASFCLNVNFIWKAPPMALERRRWMDSSKSIHHCYCSLVQWEGCTTIWSDHLLLWLE